MQQYNKRKLFTCLFVLTVFFSLAGIQTASDIKAATITSTTYKINTSNVNFRKKASTTSSKIAALKKNTSLTYLSTSKKKSGTWYKVKASVKGKTKKGYVFADYVTKTETYSFYKRTGYVKSSAVVYKSADKSSKKKTTLYKNTVVTATKYLRVNGKKWYKVSYKQNGKSASGYVLKSKITLHGVTASSKYAKNYNVTKSTTLYSAASKYSPAKVKLPVKTDIVYLNKLTVNKVKWHKVTAYVNGKSYTGYVLADKTAASSKVKTSGADLSANTKNRTFLKKMANLASTNVATLPINQKITITDTYSVNGDVWYKAKATVSGKKYSGYLPKTAIILESDAQFLISIEAFPSSYKSELKKLHEKYPNWKFVPIETGLDWDEVIKNESVVKKNTISTTVPNGGEPGQYSAPFSYLSTAEGAYNWGTDTYTLCDGTTWYTASEKVVKYYMDPRNFLNQEGIFQFEALAYNSSQSKSVVSSILKNTFMNGNYTYTDPTTKKKVTKSYASTFMTAGSQSGVSPYHLAARAKQELGLGIPNISGSVTGTYTDSKHPKDLKGYYNYYNIGANDSAGGGAIANGLTFAKTGTTYLRPWNTPYKAIIGGAQYIGYSYINKGQNTLYLQKFNVTNKSSGLYAHQYMTNIQAPTSEALKLFNSYDDLGILEDVMVFYIPVYKNMPDSPCALPEKSGNPNSYIKSITVKNQNNKGMKSYLTSSGNKKGTFNYATKAYTMTVPKTTTKLTFTATPVSKRSSITTTNLSITLPAAGASVTKSITCKAENGATTTYKFKITRSAS